MQACLALQVSDQRQVVILLHAKKSESPRSAPDSSEVHGWGKNPGLSKQGSKGFWRFGLWGLLGGSGVGKNTGLEVGQLLARTPMIGDVELHIELPLNLQVGEMSVFA